MNNQDIREIGYKEAIDFLLPKHYSGRKPQVTKAFGLFNNSNLVAVCTFGKPASPPLCVSVCGKEYADNVYELNRLCRVDWYSGQLSQFVSQCLRMLKKENWIIVSYADTAMNHHGYVYQACNFIYTGCTKQRIDRCDAAGKHARHYNKEATTLRKIRSPKHRYIYFCTNSKALKKKWKNSLRFTICEYPKGDNAEDYVLGNYLKETIID